jgi:nickel/cobalt exporter
VGVDIAGVVGTSSITPLVVLASLLASAVLGAGHALTPGHSKTRMGAYLVGSRGTALHAIALRLSVTVWHTLGIVVLAAIILQARDIAPELFNTVAPVVSGLTVIAIGGWLHGQRHKHGHSHGSNSHDDVAPPDAPIGWRSVFVLGLAGGLIPSTNALIILLAAINRDRPAYGLVLVIAFGLGMAVVLGGVGLALVFARDRPHRLPSGSGVGRLATDAPLGAAYLIFSLGIWLTSQAIGVGPAF